MGSAKQPGFDESAGKSAERKGFERELKARVRGEVYFDEISRGLYSTDASIYQIKPVAVVVGRDEADVQAAVETAAKYKVSILPRGAGTSLAGQAVAEAMVIDFSKYVNRILEINPQQRWVRVQAGMVLDELNRALLGDNLHFPIDPATSDRATVGGMIGNNASGTRSLLYGMTVDQVLEVKVLLVRQGRSEILELKESAPKDARQNSPAVQEIMAGVKRIVEANESEIKARFPKVQRKVSGYNLDWFVGGRGGAGQNLAKLIVGSEGTLATILEAKLALAPLPETRCLCVVHFGQLREALEAVKGILEFEPSAVEILDRYVLEQARVSAATAGFCGFWESDPAAVLVVEFFGDKARTAEQKANGFSSAMRKKQVGFAWSVVSEPDEQAGVWAVHKNGLGLMAKAGGQAKPAAFIEDACVPVEKLADYVCGVLEFCRGLEGGQEGNAGHSIPISMYGHAGAGTIHIRPMLNLKRQEDIDKMMAISDYAFELVMKYRGAWSAEHGDGRVRSSQIERFFGPAVYGAFKQVKRLFDPEGLMNPGVIVDPQQPDVNLRYGAGYPELTDEDLKSQYHYRSYGEGQAADKTDEPKSGFAALVEMCSGVGACRQLGEGTMCPSYRATRDEKHSTRARANILRLAMTGQLPKVAMTSKELFEVLELCLSCKACKSECPNNVDVAKLKSEFLQWYHDAHTPGLRELMIANSPLMAGLCAGAAAPLINFVLHTALARKLLEVAAGFDSRRRTPSYARVPFLKWYAKRAAPKGAANGRVVLFDDTYMKYHQTNVGIAAVELLESCGYEVIPARAGCCQRPRISHGFLRKARREGEKTLRNLDRYIQQGLQVVVVEPGCASALTDDLPDLIDDEQLARRIRENVMMIDVFLARQLEDGKLDCEFTSRFEKVLIHGHCHQKSLYGTSAMKEILRRIPHVTVEEVDSGCCGMAGSFGYEKEHYDLSMQVGQERLFPAVRRAKDAAVVACGFSCRCQIEDGTGVRPMHWVEVLRARPRQAQQV